MDEYQKLIIINLFGEDELIYTEYKNGEQVVLSCGAEKDDDFNRILNKNRFARAIDKYNKNIYKENATMTYEKFISDEYCIVLEGEAEDIVEFLNNNDIKNKKILVASPYEHKISITNDEFTETLLDGLNYIDNVYIEADGNQNAVKLSEYSNTVSYIDTIVERVKEKNFSPMEQLLYVYDIVRDRKYIEEDEDEDKTISRDLTSVTSGEKIVCLGFSEIFDKVVKRLGFKSDVNVLTEYNTIHGHARNRVYVDDPKYNLKGIYFFDTTYGSKRDNTNNHFNSYYFFAKTDDFFNLFDLYCENEYDYGKIDTLISVAVKIYEDRKDEIDASELCEIDYLHKTMFKEKLFHPVEIVAIITGVPKEVLANFGISEDKHEIYDKIISFINMFNTELSIEDFMKILTTVRSIEYYEDENKFPLSKEKIYEITSRSIPNKKINKNEELNQQISRVKLAKTLRKVLEQKKK